MYPTLFTTPGLAKFAEEVDAERARQLNKFGDQRHPNGTGPNGTILGRSFAVYEEVLRTAVDQHNTSDAAATPWALILLEEAFEVLNANDPASLRAELIQVAAVCAAWVSDIDRRPTVPACQCLPASPAAPRTYCDACLAAGASPS